MRRRSVLEKEVLASSILNATSFGMGPRMRRLVTGAIAGAMAGAMAIGSPVRAQSPGNTLPAWARGATCYEVFVRSFADSDGDGVGDINGLIAKLDYINDGNPRSTGSLGARCIWLMPIMESPSYHGYDQTDYYAVDREYGTTADFKRLTAEAHRRGIRVLVDMVLNHSSNRHPYFLEALRDTASRYRSWYRIASPKPTERGPWGQDAWIKSPVRDEYYYAIFDRTQPDLNYANPGVREEGKKIARYWLEEMGVDGFRLDAVPYLSEDHGLLQGSPDTHAYLREYAAYVKSVKADAYTVGEVFDSLGAQLPYYPDQLDSYFAFELADSIIAGVKARRATGVLEPVLRLQASVPTGRFSPFLRNHDQNRTRTELGGDIAMAKVAAVIMLSMPGVPFVYYGEEIGMIGAKPDERLRTPMQWRPTRGGGFTSGTPWEPFQRDSATTTVAAQEGVAGSLLDVHRRMIHLRAARPNLTTGALVPLTTRDSAVVAFLRRDGERLFLVMANLGDRPAINAAISTQSDVLPRRQWRASMLLGSGAPRRTTTANGALTSFVPLARLAPTSAYVLELTPR